MKHERDMRGAIPVAAMERLPATEALLVQLLRAWCDGPKGRVRAQAALVDRLGAARGEACHAAFTQVMQILQRHGRRRLVRHHADCGCVGADEAILAHFVSTAATGEREDAMLIASLLVDGAVLMPLTEAAVQLGLHLRRAEGRAGGQIPEPARATRH